MATRVREMRKSPRQQRSRATAEVIVTAAARVLAGGGWGGFTTNAVAAAAGVSIGSVYQYFADKAALLEAVRRRHHEQVLAVLAEAAARPPAERAQALIDGMIVAHGPAPGLHHALLQQRPASDGALDREFEAEYLRLYAALFPAGGDGGDAALAARVLASAVEGVIHDAACAGGLEGAVLRGELTTLASAYMAARVAGGPWPEGATRPITAGTALDAQACEDQ
ncbi:MAG: TetR/AcrR family transcriptional regulator [Caulobacteraceae bacterium]|nr:TetR/AcrR family transcriptional regulator [Caulobacteraceae bacterium]